MIRFLYHTVLARIPLSLCFIPPNLTPFFLLVSPSFFVFPLYRPRVLNTRKSKAAGRFPTSQSIIVLCLTLGCSMFRLLATPDFKNPSWQKTTQRPL